MRDKTAGEIKKAIGTSYATLTRLNKNYGLGRDKVHGVYVYAIEEVKTSINKRDKEAQIRRDSRRGKPRKFKKRTRDFSAGNSAEPIVLKPIEPEKKREIVSYEDGVDPKKCGSFVLRMARGSGSNTAALEA